MTTTLSDRLSLFTTGSGRRAALGLIAAIGLSSGLAVSHAEALEVNEQGWTVLEPSVDTRFIFVSSSEGSDTNTGLSPSKAVKTLARAKELMRDDSPDWLLLKRGDTWSEGFGTWKLSGRSADERMVISSYGEGDERPELLLRSGNAILGWSGRDVSHVAFVGIAMVADREPSDNSAGIRWLSIGEDLLIEDCLISGFKDNIVCQAVDGRYANLALRRNVIVDSWSTDGHSQGLYVYGTDGVLLEENIFDHNGWNPSVANAQPTQFNQNIYLQTTTFGVEFIGNITSRASAAGIQMRTGGDAESNLIYANPTGMRFGYRTLDWPSEAATGRISGNVVLGGELSDPAMIGAGIGLSVERADDLLVKDNVVAHYGNGNVAWAFTLGAYADEVVYDGNVVYGWSTGKAMKMTAEVQGLASFVNNQWQNDGADQIIEIRHDANLHFDHNRVYGFDQGSDAFIVNGSQLNYHEWETRDDVDHSQYGNLDLPDSGRDLDAYARHLGYDDAGDFLQAARGMSRAHWDSRLTGRAACEWIRAGYIVED